MKGLAERRQGPEGCPRRVVQVSGRCGEVAHGGDICGGSLGPLPVLHAIGRWEKGEGLWGGAQRHEGDGGTSGQSIFRG